MTQEISTSFVSTIFCSVFALSSLLVFSATGGTVTNSADSGPGTLRQEVADASPGDTIDFDAGVSHISLASGGIDINKSLTIDGGGNVTINGGSDRIFSLSGSPRTWNILGLFITNGLASGAGSDAFGGGIRMSADTHANTLVVSNCTIANCSADDFGGGIYIHSGTVSSKVSICDCAIGDNTAGLEGGGIHTDAGLNLDYVLFSGNTCGDDGGALYSSDDTVTSTWRNVTFRENEATGNGGAIYAKHVAADIVDCTFTGNVAGVGGGAVLTAGLGAFHGLPECNIVISNCVFASNRVTLAYAYNHNGGAVFVGASNGDRDNVELIDCSFVSNRCGNDGAGLYNSGFCTVSNCEFVGNEARRGGGGINNDEGFLTIDDTSIRNNTTLDSGNYGGGGLRTSQFPPDSAWTTIRNSSISGNTCASGGGGIRNYQRLTMIDCLVSNNVNNSGSGGGLWLYSDDTSVTCSLDHVLLVDNRSTEKGGAIYIERARVSVIDSEFVRNSATNKGGGIYVESYGTPYLLLERTGFRENVSMFDSYYNGAGGAILSRERVTISGCAFVSNSAPAALGGGLALDGTDAKVTIINTTFSGNTRTIPEMCRKPGVAPCLSPRAVTWRRTIQRFTPIRRPRRVEAC